MKPNEKSWNISLDPQVFTAQYFGFFCFGTILSKIHKKKTYDQGKDRNS